jgi:hypothetical protein
LIDPFIQDIDKEINQNGNKISTYPQNRQDNDSDECLRLNPDDEVNRCIAVVDQATARNRPKNTNESCRPKILEFKAYCRYKYPGDGCTTVALERVHKFMCYQAHRKKKKWFRVEERLMDHDGSKAKKVRSIYYVRGILDGTRLR